MNLLEQARREIDAIDDQMARLFTERMEAVKKVIQYKKENNLPILDSGREEEVIEKNYARLSAQSQEEIGTYYRDFIVHNMEISRQFQRKVLATDCVAYQGVPGAFSHIAKRILFPHSPERSYKTWKEVVEAVEQGVVTYGVLPFENSHAGDVCEVLDLCYRHPHIHVSHMYDLAVEQNLLGLPNTKLSEIKTVVSHPQALAQSAPFLDGLSVEKQNFPNTAAAAAYVEKLGDKTVGAIAAKETAKLYHLEVLAPNINESSDNTTRFLVITKEVPSLGNRFSLLFTIKHEAGSLAEVITHVANDGFNMESIKSRPMPQARWEYYFYMELVGNQEQALKLQEKLKEICHSVRILGVYNREDGQ